MREDAAPPIDPTEANCPVCDAHLGDDEQGLPICRSCDRALEAQLDLYLGYSDAARALAQAIS